MQMNFFGWIREGVKQSVLLGVSDAVENLGMPPESEESNEKLLSFLRDETGGQALPAPRGASGGKNAGGKRRLGRSLKTIAADEK
ncbi:MAG: hypothetical protein RIC55_22625 [Pirellulaceae bacterium]